MPSSDSNLLPAQTEATDNTELTAQQRRITIIIIVVALVILILVLATFVLLMRAPAMVVAQLRDVFIIFLALLDEYGYVNNRMGHIPTTFFLREKTYE